MDRGRDATKYAARVVTDRSRHCDLVVDLPGSPSTCRVEAPPAALHHRNRARYVRGRIWAIDGCTRFAPKAPVVGLGLGSPA